MTTIELVDLVISNMVLDFEKECVTVAYHLVDSQGTTWKRGEGVFWVTMPDLGEDEFGNPIPIPDNWFLIPPSYLSTLVGLRNDADQALTNRFLV